MSTTHTNISVFARTGRSMWYVAYEDPTTLMRVNKVTPYPLVMPDGKKRAYDFAAKLAATDEFRESRSEVWAAWVEPHLVQRYKRMPVTLSRYMTSWRYVRTFLIEKKIPGPRAVTIQTVRDFIDWRTAQTKRSGKSVSHNTAVMDVKMFQIVLNEAMRRDWIQKNPAKEVGVSRTAAKKKREISDDEMARILVALDAKVKEEPDAAWMRIAWEIARWQGCRLSETQIDLTRQVNFEDETITFHAKGRNGEPHVFETKLHPGLKPFLLDMVQRKKTFTCRFPKMGVCRAGAASKIFRRFFDGLGLRDISFHCTRVTVITKLARAGTPISQAMAYVGHADEEVHRIYQKLKARDLGQAASAVVYTRASAPTPGSAGS